MTQCLDAAGEKLGLSFSARRGRSWQDCGVELASPVSQPSKQALREETQQMGLLSWLSAWEREVPSLLFGARNWVFEVTCC